MDARRLDTLPIEIIWRVARHCPADDVLSAARVCRRLRDALYDTLVFKQVLESLDPSMRNAIDAATRENGNETAAWARLAVAECRLQRAFADPPDKDQDEDEEDFGVKKVIDQYLPALMTLDQRLAHTPNVVEKLLYPISILCSKIPRRPTRGRNSRNPYNVALRMTSPGAAFALCMAGLAAPSRVERYEEGQAVCQIIGACANTVEDEEDELYGTGIMGNSFGAPLALVAFAAWSSLLAKHIEFVDDPSEVRMPNALTIPLLNAGSSGSIPLPFQVARPRRDGSECAVGGKTSWDEWYESHIAHMSQVDFLTQGDWCGYWSFDNQGGDFRAVDFAESIQCMRLQIIADTHRRSSRRGPPPLRIRATYPNNSFDFVLEGSITADGVFDLGPPGDFWVWRGRLLPFGLFGFWGSADWTRIAGACWLWKKEWCGPTPKTADAETTGEDVPHAQMDTS